MKALKAISNIYLAVFVTGSCLAIVLYNGWNSLYTPVVTTLWALYMTTFAFLNKIRENARLDPDVVALKQWASDVVEVQKKRFDLGNKVIDFNCSITDEQYFAQLPSTIKEAESLREEIEELILRGENLMERTQEEAKDGVRTLLVIMRNAAASLGRLRDLMARSL